MASVISFPFYLYFILLQGTSDTFSLVVIHEAIHSKCADEEFSYQLDDDVKVATVTFSTGLHITAYLIMGKETIALFLMG